MNNTEKILENAKNNSIGAEKKNKLIKKIKQISPRLIALLLTILMSVSLCACGKNNEEVFNENDSDNFIRGHSYVQLCKDDIIYLLEGYEIDYQESNSVDDYRKIENISESDLIIYYDLLGKEECEKVVQSLGYKNWDDFLIKNNYLDENKEPSIIEWKRNSYISVGESLIESEYAK